MGTALGAFRTVAAQNRLDICPLVGEPAFKFAIDVFRGSSPLSIL